MILNIFGPSGSGKTTLIKELLKNKKLQTFFENISKEKNIKIISNEISISLIPLPKFSFYSIHRYNRLYFFR